jgi:hypothetical protein
VGRRESSLTASRHASQWVTVQVRNVAFGLYTVVAEGKNGRYGIYDGDFDWELLAREGRQYRPDLDASIPYVTEDKKTPVEQGTYSIDTSKAEKDLGYKRKHMIYHIMHIRSLRLNLAGISRETMVRDVLKQFETLGALKK